MINVISDLEKRYAHICGMICFVCISHAACTHKRYTCFVGTVAIV